MSNLSRSTLRPGLLVGMKTSITGNMRYRSATLEDKLTEKGVHLTKWETTRTVYDPAEYERAVKVRSKVRGCITSVCADTAFGLLCPEDRMDELNAAAVEARGLADDFNSTARYTRINFNLITGLVASDDVSAMQAINGEVRDLLSSMQRGIENLDAKAIRDAAYKTRMIGQMLSPKAQERVREAIDMARASARKITKAGEAAAQEIDHAAIAAIAQRRTAFLDLDDADEVVVPTRGNGRAVDLLPASPAERLRAAKNKEELDSQLPPIDKLRPPGRRARLAASNAAKRSDRDPSEDFPGTVGEMIREGSKVIDAVNEARDSGEADARRIVNRIEETNAKQPKRRERIRLDLDL